MSDVKFDENLSGSMLKLRERMKSKGGRVAALERVLHRARVAYSEDQPRDDQGQWSSDGGGSSEGEKRPIKDAGEAARELRSEAYAHEEAASETMRLVADAAGAELLGFDFRLKGEDSLERKIQEKIDRGMSNETAQESIGDALRYTVGLEPDHYTGGTTIAINALEDASWTTRGEPKNYWEQGDSYSGLNVNMRDPDGLNVEVQFHTPQSFEVKNETHRMYEEARLPETSPARFAELESQQAEMWASVPIPKDVFFLGELRRTS